MSDEYESFSGTLKPAELLWSYLWQKISCKKKEKKGLVSFVPLP